MASTIEPGSSLAEIIPTLDLSQIPAKLHCHTCKGFLVNAYKTSCCEQTICEPCYQNLADHCPSCKHKPFSQDLCRMAKALRGTAKAYLKSLEKSRMEVRDSAKASEAPAVDEQTPIIAEDTAETLEPLNTAEVEHIDLSTLQVEESVIEDSTIAEVQPSIENGSPIHEPPINGTRLPEVDDEQTRRQASESTDANDDEVEIQVEPSQEDEQYGQSHLYNDEEDRSFGNHENEEASEKQEDSKGTPDGTNMNNYGMSNMGMGLNNMDMNSMAMMQMMMQNGMSSMMGLPMGMNAGMFGGLSGQNGGMNGMNMGMMNFNPYQNMSGWNGQSNNSWQNNNANAYSNGMSGDFSSQFGFDNSQQGNFQQQQFRNGDFQTGYSGYRGRGRGRGRGGYGRGRGHFNQYSQNNHQGYQNAHEQQQNEIQHMQSQMMNGQGADSRGSKDDTNDMEEVRNHTNEDFAPGGQDEVNEALANGKENPKEEAPPQAVSTQVADMGEDKQEPQDDQQQESNVVTGDTQAVREEPRSIDKLIPEAYHEDFDSMAPPSAPVGPSGRYGDRDFGFRSRGHGRFASRGRGSFPISNGHAASPIRSVSQTSIPTQSPPAKGVGVQGAPTGPRAMRDPPPAKPAPRATGGFQIMGRAAMQSQTPQPHGEDRTRSQSPATDHDNHGDARSRQPSRHARQDSRYENGSDAGYDRADRDRKRKKSRRDDHDDYEMEEADQRYSRSDSQDRKTSHRSSRYEKDRDRDKDNASSKHRSSRRHHEEELNGDHEMDGYGDRAESRSSKHRSSHKSSAKTSSKYDDRLKEKEDRHRKRSRHDRDRDEEYDDPVEDESRHRSRRHKKEHHSSSKRDRERDNERDVDDDVGLRINGRSAGRKTSVSNLPTPTSAMTPSIVDKDPHTLEREARNRERMAKEAQRREKAAQGNPTSQKHGRGTVSGGRRVSYKYEDEVERGMDERDSARWR